MPKKYPVEKILYFADKPERLHVAPTEKERSTDLWLDVQRLVDRGELERVAEDDSGWYYGTTSTGKEKLLILQIQWRRDNGKPTQKERDALAALRASA